MYLSSMYRLLISRILFFIFFRTNHGARNGVMNNNTKKNNNNHQCSLFLSLSVKKICQIMPKTMMMMKKL